ncbi:DndE family protein [Aliarcobacter butzleri]|uniref:DndE family protein n=1 Tax=Aliarcobacter butzleri TaxID=28197 RepID=UPI00263CE532|nr:DndE family protein [Aliarcobacter butzleri]MDN5111037.1 DndE family protein [Aliarcobacter butzleri]
MRTTAYTEQQIPRIAKLLGFEKEPKWVTIRFAIFISLSIKEDLESIEKIDFSDGKSYPLEVITGKGKVDNQGSQADYTDMIALFIANYENKKVNTLRGLELKLEEHCERGFIILASSLNENSNIFEWLKQEFI